MALFRSVPNGEVPFLPETVNKHIAPRRNGPLNAPENLQLSLEQVNVCQGEISGLRNLIAQARNALQDQQHNLSAAQATLERLLTRQRIQQTHMNLENISKMDADLVEGLSCVANDIARQIKETEFQVNDYERSVRELRQQCDRLESEQGDWELTLCVARESIAHLNTIIQEPRVDIYAVDLPISPVGSIPDLPISPVRNIPDFPASPIRSMPRSIWTRILQLFI